MIVTFSEDTTGREPGFLLNWRGRLEALKAPRLIVGYSDFRLIVPFGAIVAVLPFWFYTELPRVTYFLKGVAWGIIEL